MWGQRLTWITDCYAIKFIPIYDGINPVVFCIQMCLMLWVVNIFHRTGNWLIWSDYFSRLGIDTTFDPILDKNAALNDFMLKRYPPPTGPMEPHMRPGFLQRQAAVSTSRTALFQPLITFPPLWYYHLL